MPTFTATPITVDGVVLDGYAWGVEAKTRTFGQVRPGSEDGNGLGDIVLPGVDGEMPVLNEDFEPTFLTLGMFVRGTDANGIVPGGSTAIAECEANMDTLSFLFGKRHALLDVQHDTKGTGALRQALCKVVTAIEPDILPGRSARFKVQLKIPGVFWQDLLPSEWASTPTLVSGNSYEVTTLQGGVAPISDAIITVTGPATNPQLVDMTTGAYVRLNAAVPAGQVWRLNCGTWASRYGAGLVFTSADTAGTDGQAVTVFGGGKASFLRMQPDVMNGARRVHLTVTGTGFTSATAIGVRARRKYFQ